MTGRLAVRAVTGGLGRGPRGQLTTLWSGPDWCVIPRCDRQIDPSRLMCRTHWYMVPKELRDRVWATWRSGQGAFTGDHLDAVRLAVAAVSTAAGDPVPGRSGQSKVNRSASPVSSRCSAS
ncbi:MAG TPA: hypothetical protein VFW16_14135 [Streptosporangiaceae bacterium]|nr:hypothetical protein [Streptosporangiaceae bacterium]